MVGITELDSDQPRAACMASSSLPAPARSRYRGARGDRRRTLLGLGQRLVLGGQRPGDLAHAAAYRVGRGSGAAFGPLDGELATEPGDQRREPGLAVEGRIAGLYAL